METDVLEKTAKRLEVTTWMLFKEICEMSGISCGRVDMFWDGYITEGFIPDFINQACYKICLGTTWQEGRKDAQ